MGMLSSVHTFWNKHVHFLELHYAYIMFLCFFFSGCYYFDPSGVRSPYIDALFMMVSSSTCTGLNTVTISTMSVYQQCLLFISSIFGSHVFISIVIVYVRKHAFESRFKEIVEYNRKKRQYETLQNRRSTDLENGSGFSGLGKRLSHIPFHRTSDDLHPEIQIIRRPSILEDLSAAKREEEEEARQQSQNSSMSNFLHHPNAITNMTPAQSPRHSLHGTPNVSRPGSMIGSVHPLEHDAGSNASESSSTQNENDAVLPATDNRNSDEQTDANAQTIMFADDVEVQRQRARNRLQKNRTDEGSNSDYVHRDLSSLVDKEQLTQEERFNLGGAEYRALHTLSRIVPLYYLCIPVICSFIFRIYFATSSYGQWVLDTSNGSGSQPINYWYFSFFSGIAGFNNVGLIPLDDSVVPFQKSSLYLLIMSFLILVGNTAFALLLRLVIWTLWRLTPHQQQMHKDSLRFLLDHPRRCFTTLFPSAQTWWLFLILFIITVTELVLFLLLNYWLPVVADIPWGYRVLDGLFQSISTRNAGFSVVNIADVNPSLTIIFIVAMYISVYPVTISMRRTNVYQERSLGIYGGEDGENADDTNHFTDTDLTQAPSFVRLRRSNTLSSMMTTTRGIANNFKKPDFFVMQQIQRQLSSDMAWIVTGIFLITVIESAQIMNTSPITVFSIIYECVSAFANVGASLGYPETSTSQSASYHVLSKLIVIALMYRGRHRGKYISLMRYKWGREKKSLPAAIDRAVLLPSEQWQQAEQEDLQLKRRATSSSLNVPEQGASSAVFYRSRTM